MITVYRPICFGCLGGAVVRRSVRENVVSHSKKT